MPRFRRRYINREIFWEIIGCAALFGGIIGFYSAPMWAPILLAATLRL